MRIVALVAPAFRASIDALIVSDLDGLRREIEGAGVLVIAPRYGEMLRDAWPHMGSVRWIHSLGAGVEKLPFDLLRGSDVVVTNSRGIYADALAEWVLAAILWFAKKLGQRLKSWEPLVVDRLEGATLGIIGYGSIGRAIGARASAFGMQLLTARSKDPVDEICRESDYVVLSTPLTTRTTRLMNATRIGLMKPSAVLINISRGAVVDEAALVAALRDRRIGGAALDVFEVEPLPSDSPLWALDNVLLSPHSADRTRDSHERAVAFFKANLERFRQGQTLENIVDKTAGY